MLGKGDSVRLSLWHCSRHWRCTVNRFAGTAPHETTPQLDVGDLGSRAVLGLGLNQRDSWGLGESRKWNKGSEQGSQGRLPGRRNIQTGGNEE